jgi:hypothetical protein
MIGENGWRIYWSVPNSRRLTDAGSSDVVLRLIAQYINEHQDSFNGAW